MNFHDKYLKYKFEYNSLKALENKILDKQNIQNMSGGVRYDCKPDNEFIKICEENNNGKYKTKESCFNDCELQYIRNQIKKIKIDGETSKFYYFIKELISTEKFSVYLKGGNVLGMKVLKMIHDRYKNDNNKFKEKFKEFLKLDLIKDWDFSAYSKKPITDEYRTKLDEIAYKYHLHPRAKTFILYQTKKPILLDDKPLFEISLLDSDTWSKLEIPLTTMKIKVSEYNLKYVYMFCKLFYSYKINGEDFDFDILKKMLSKIDVIIYPHKNGFYNVKNNFDKGELNSELIKFIGTFNDYDVNLPQFLATHIEDPFRILYRLPEKNIIKNDKIKAFINKHLGIQTTDWLFDSTSVKKIINLFCEKLGDKIAQIYKDTYISTFDSKIAFAKVDSFMEGVAIGRRIETDYNMLSENGKKLLDLIFGKLIKEMEKTTINTLNINTNLFKFIKFYANK